VAGFGALFGWTLDRTSANHPKLRHGIASFVPTELEVTLRFATTLERPSDSRRVKHARSEQTMYVEDIADIRALRPWVALSVTMERHAIRLGKLFAGELFVHRERARHAAALLQTVAEAYFQ